jgi:hypothetical protein
MVTKRSKKRKSFSLKEPKMKRICLTLGIFILIVSSGLSDTFNYTGSGLDMRDNNSWTLSKSGSYWDVLYGSSLSAHECQFWNKYGGETYANRGAYLWQAPTNEVITGISYYGAVAGYLTTFNAAVFTSPDPAAALSTYNLGWSKCSSGPGPWWGESKALNFSAGEGIKSIGVGFEDTTSDNTHQVKFSDIVVETTRLDRGWQWVRSHPFSINAYVEFPVNMPQYAAMGFSNTIACVNPENPEWISYTDSIFGGSVNQGLGWHWYYRWTPGHDEEAVNGVLNLRNRFGGNLGFSIGDENPIEELPQLGKLHSRIRQATPDALIYCALHGMDLKPEYQDANVYRSYIDSVISHLRPDVLVYDQYPFYGSAVAGNFFLNLAIVREKALAAGLPYWNWLQSFDYSDQFAPQYHTPSESELRLQAFVSLTYGYTGLSYWTYASNYYPFSTALIDASGQRTAMGESTATILPELRTLGEELKLLTSTDVYYCASWDYQNGQWVSPQPMGTVLWANQDSRIQSVQVSNGPWGFLLGFFDKSDGKKYMMVTNCNNGENKTALETQGAITIQFTSSITSLKRLDRKTGTWQTLQLRNNKLLHHIVPGGTGDLFQIGN